MRSRKKKILIVIALLAVFPISGRLHAWWSAVNFGNVYTAAFGGLGKDGFTDTEEMKSFFEAPLLKVHYNRAERLKFLGGGYSRRIDDFKTGMIYLSQQASVTMEQRFAAPPKLEYFSIDTNDRTNQGVIDAAGKLVSDYNRQVSVP